MKIESEWQQGAPSGWITSSGDGHRPNKSVTTIQFFFSCRMQMNLICLVSFQSCKKIFLKREECCVRDVQQAGRFQTNRWTGTERCNGRRFHTRHQHIIKGQVRYGARQRVVRFTFGVMRQHPVYRNHETLSYFSAHPNGINFFYLKKPKKKERKKIEWL